ncbi:sterol carrier family protein [Pseudactinotalea terrae]|uniref:sterol carrier family protein n=1 Tax=Pseudactinotalea terrae TaxID=1743262 RepID=UPI0012E26B22|nr:sterol carrier family protein [Pseudactinotalea terrae]
MARRRISRTQGEAALVSWRAGEADRSATIRAVRYLLEELGERAPGHAVEVRVPPAGVVQVVEGPRHTRGTPPNVVETSMETWLRLATGTLAWSQALAAGEIAASGLRADLSDLLPLFPITSPGEHAGGAEGRGAEEGP